MGIFEGLDKAEYFEGGVYVGPGLHYAEIQKCKSDKTRGGRPFFVVEMKVLESSTPDKFPVGTNFSWMVMLDKNKESALGNIKHFISVAGSLPEKEVTEKDADEAVAEANPLMGVKLRLSAVNQKTKAGGDFTKVKFMPDTVSAEAAGRMHADAQKAGAQAPAA